MDGISYLFTDSCLRLNREKEEGQWLSSDLHFVHIRYNFRDDITEHMCKIIKEKSSFTCSFSFSKKETKPDMIITRNINLFYKQHIDHTYTTKSIPKC